MASIMHLADRTMEDARRGTVSRNAHDEHNVLRNPQVPGFGRKFSHPSKSSGASR